MGTPATATKQTVWQAADRYENLSLLIHKPPEPLRYCTHTQDVCLVSRTVDNGSAKHLPDPLKLTQMEKTP